MGTRALYGMANFGRRAGSRRFTAVIGTSGRSIFSLRLALAVGFALAGPAQASTIFDSLSFTLSNTPGCMLMNLCGTATVMGSDLVFMGANTGSGLSGDTFLLTTAPAAGTVLFDWSYSTLNSPGAEVAGYVLGMTFVSLADTNLQMGTGVTFAVSQGQTFGFEIQAADNMGEPGIITIENFSAPNVSTPEPGSFALAAAGIAIAAWKCKMRNPPNTRGQR